MGERRGTKALELWCRRITEGYPGVNVQNMTTSWRDGLAFCAMIHHFRPDLIDFNSLNKDDVYGNNELAFRTAEQHLGIPALLDAEDMASCSVPDRLSILTYLSQFYQTFGGSSPSRLAMSRTTETADERIAPVPESPKPKEESRLGIRRDPCTMCSLPVFLAEKLMVEGSPYHRTCFRCARCNHQLTPGNYYATEEGQYCCETCPDEETFSTSMHQKYNEVIISGDKSSRNSDEEDVVTGSTCHRSLSDEEKTERLLLVRNDPYISSQHDHHDSPVPDSITQTSKMRLNFMTSHMLADEIDDAPIVSSPQLDRSLDDSVKNPCVESGGERTNGMNSVFPDDDENDESEEAEECNSAAGSSPKLSYPEKAKVEPTGEHFAEVKNVVHNALDVSLDNKKDEEEQRVTAISFHDAVKDRSTSLVEKENTKELLGQTDVRADAEEHLSLVQKRLRMFEIRDKKDPDQRRDVGRKKSFDGVSESKVHEKNCPAISIKDHKEESRTDLEISEIHHTDSPAETSKFSKSDDSSEEALMIDKAISTKQNLSGMSETKNLNEENSESESKNIITSNSSTPKDSVEDLSVNPAQETSLTAAEGIDLSTNTNYPEDLNPFKSDDEENVTDSHQAQESSKTNKVSTNPFDSDDDEEDQKVPISPPKPAARSTVSKPQTADAPIKRRLVAPKISLNPFWSDEEDDHDSDLDSKDRTVPDNCPVPKPRTLKSTPELGVRKAKWDRGGMYASNSSITSSESITTPGGTYRKKKPAPPPPLPAKELFPPEQSTSVVPKSLNNSLEYYGVSPRTTPRARKSKPAPPPPMPTSTPYNVTTGAPLSFAESPIPESLDSSENHDMNLWEDQKTNKDETNRNRQSLTNISGEENLSYKPYQDKSVQGKWKRKKGPAPPRPIPHRRKIKVMSMKDVKLELDEIELQQQGLERQGVRLEQLIRDKSESGPRTDDSSLSMDVEELVLELFALVNEKNELFRRQAELMLLKRQQRLEEEHAEIEYQIRCLMSQPEATKTDFDKQREEALIQRLVEIVERRNEIVECLEMDRRREVEEDRSIHKHMGLFAARNKNEISSTNNDNFLSAKSKKVKTKEKGKEKKVKKVTKKDADKDIDETEVKLKRHNKRKWF